MKSRVVLLLFIFLLWKKQIELVVVVFVVVLISAVEAENRETKYHENRKQRQLQHQQSKTRWNTNEECKYSLVDLRAFSFRSKRKWWKKKNERKIKPTYNQKIRGWLRMIYNDNSDVDFDCAVVVEKKTNYSYIQQQQQKQLVYRLFTLSFLVVLEALFVLYCFVAWLRLYDTTKHQFNNNK